ncbi:MAG: uracil-DNA glycosylase [Bacteroidetes bacterium]|nr:uracil-DNA glycosylase [Bacteroidota bacterium]MBU1721017.1 uracil-DNA glycosylase [Bacteroidota bacterium]
MKPNIEVSWAQMLQEEFQKPYFSALKEFLLEEKANFAVYPPGKLIFNAFDRTPFKNVKIIILGQDPYHGERQAHGLSFSVPMGIKLPPSLVNIFKEVHQDVGISMPVHGNLEKWAKQGVLLMNATLTVRATQAGSHQGKGWELFTDEVIRLLSQHRKNLVFMLWGRYARNKKELIDQQKHYVLESAHPSPLSAYNGFIGCKHFSKANSYLRQNGITEIDWQV